MLLATLIAFMNKDVLTGKHNAFVIRETLKGKTATASKLRHWIDLLPAFARLYNQKLAYSPDLRLFFECYRKHPISQPLIKESVDGIRFAEICNDFISTLRNEGKRSNLAYQLRQWMRNSTENRKKLRRYLKALFSSHSRLVVIRVDLHLGKDSLMSVAQAKEAYQHIVNRCHQDYQTYMEGADLDKGFDTDAMQSFQLMMTERDKFLNAMRRKYEKKMVGYVWAMEFSASGHYHIHVCFFFNGAMVDGDKHSWLAQETCDFWKQTTEGNGYSFNCNRKQYDTPACGIVEYHDAQKINYLITSLDYLAKNTQLVRVKSAKGKTFNTGRMPGTRLPGSAGRPRSKASAVIDEDF